MMAAAAAAMANDEQMQHRFPPFPDPPQGVSVVPFGAFVPAGYRRVVGPSGDPIEVDAWAGVQTIKMLTKEEASQIRRDKRRRRNAGNAVDSDGRRIPWWEEWEEGEELRAMSITSFDGMNIEDRVCLAADDFRVGRTWPEISHGVRLLWDQFRLYIGLISSIPVYKKTKSDRAGNVDVPNNAAEASDEEGDVPRAKQTKIDIVQDYLEQSALPGKQLEPAQDVSTEEAKRLREFLSDMEKTVKVFLSSHMRDSGLIWTGRNLFIAPNLLYFFLRFMLRNKVFADSAEHLDNLKRAVSVAALGRKELPITARLGQILPGKFDIACRELWGHRGSLTIQISAAVPPGGVDDAPVNNISPSDPSSAFETELKKSDVEVVPSDVVLDSITARQVMEDNLDTDHEVPVTTIPVAGNPWLAAIRAEECTTDSWTDVSIPWLMQLLGPSAFPLIMTTGIVEFSTRRIRDVIPAGVDVHNKKKGGKTTSSVEEDLGERFFRVVMSPWVQSATEETADFPRPVIVPGSRGAVVEEATSDDPHAWSPYRDNVTILVSAEVAEQMAVGMGLCGTWVQMVPEDAYERHAGECYWYTESLVASFPSYYTEGETVGQQALVEEEDDL